MKLKLLSIAPSTRQDKRLMATFSDGTVIHFGLKGASTFVDHRDAKMKLAYIARHSINEDWTDPLRAGTLSRYILWNKPSLSASIEDFKKLFDL